jgi:hypothetical protein
MSQKFAGTMTGLTVRQRTLATFASVLDVMYHKVFAKRLTAYLAQTSLTVVYLLAKLSPANRSHPLILA